MSSVIDTTDVHIGHWINWSRGNSVLGSTITLTRRNGALLTAFIAIFVAFAGKRIWKIAAFITHLILTKDPQSHQDGLFHQRQAILRNSADAETTMVNLLKVALAWHKSKSKRSIFRHLGPLAVTALIFGLAFGVAGVFSAQISSVGNEVLLSGKHCTFLNETISNEDIFAIYLPYTSELIQASVQRAQQCYISNTTSTASCPTFVKPRLPLSITRNASCPFDQSRNICQSNTSNLIVDTGYINSHFDLGINAPPAERILYRFLTQCAPLNLDGFSDVAETATTDNGTLFQFLPGSNQPWMRYYYGTSGVTNTTNFTYQYPINVPLNRSDFVGSTTIWEQDYTLTALQANSNNTDAQFAGFSAIPDLSKVDADTLLFFLSPNSVVFTAPTDDPWYSAQRGPFDFPVRGTTNTNGGFQGWFGDNPVGVLGCTQQVQFCNSTVPGGCSPLMGFALLNAMLDSLKIGVLPPWTDHTQSLRFLDFGKTLGDFGFMPQKVVTTLGPTALLSRRNFDSGSQGSLPSNQWQLDVEYWISIQLATIQRAFIEAANGPNLPQSDLYPPQNAIDNEFCTRQKVISSDYTSFSTLGLGLILAIGGFFILLSYPLEYILFWIQQRWHWKTYPLTEWWMNETLQLQSMANEETGVGPWTRKIGVVPITQRGDELLAVLDISDPGHPRLKAPPSNVPHKAGRESSDSKEGCSRIEVLPSGGEAKQDSSTVMLEDVKGTSTSKDQIDSPLEVSPAGQSSDAVDGKE